MRNLIAQRNHKSHKTIKDFHYRRALMGDMDCMDCMDCMDFMDCMDMDAMGQLQKVRVQKGVALA